MVNVNYRRGANKEYRVKKKYQQMGMTVVRSAGSHGPYDLCAIDFEKRKIHFIQCKPSDLSESAKDKLLMDNERLNGTFTCSFEVE